VLTATDQKQQKIIKKVILPTITLPECQRDYKFGTKLQGWKLRERKIRGWNMRKKVALV